MKRIAEALNVSVDFLVYGEQEQKAKNKINDDELLSMFARVQTLNKADISTVKNLLNAYILKTDLQQKLAV